ncbi:hypothetical protein B0H13DRAFT_2370794 [Mycena leptocephala]|nr:hypothetical protein B0H13DRAFT_2370794 [Mycena leptocephala]
MRVAVLVALSSLRVEAQVVSSSWRVGSSSTNSALLLSLSPKKPNISMTTAERVTLAAAALDTGISRLNATAEFDGEAAGVAARLYAEMAEFDIATNQTTYQAVLEEYFPLAATGRTNFSDGAIFGRAAARAYVAYKNPTFLDYAVQSWWFGRAYTISPADAASGSISTKDFPIWEHALDDTSSLSALLAEATSDPMYLQAAMESVQFVHAHLLHTDNVVRDGLSGSASHSCSTNLLLEPYNSGLIIQGLAVLGDITGNCTIQNLLNEILLAAIPTMAWQKSDGIVGDPEMVDGLGAVYFRKSTTHQMQQYVEGYLAVQFNAVLDLATKDGTNIYGGSWRGPPSTDFSARNQTNALSALINALTLGMSSGSSPAHTGSATTGSYTAGATPIPSSTIIISVATGSPRSYTRNVASSNSHIGPATDRGGKLGPVLRPRVPVRTFGLRDDTREGPQTPLRRTLTPG